MEIHFTVIGILYLVSGGLGFLSGIFVFLMLASIGSGAGDPDLFALLGLIGFFVGGLITLFSIPSLVGGVALLQRRSWSRILLLVVGALHLLSIPFGTALGIYTIWALTRPEAVPMLAPQP